MSETITENPTTDPELEPAAAATDQEPATAGETTEQEIAPSSAQLGWLKSLYWERGIDGDPAEDALTAGEASALIRGFLKGTIGTPQPITEEQADAIRKLQAELGPAPNGDQEMPTDRSGANRLLRKLNQVRFARAGDRAVARLTARGVTIQELDEKIPF